MSLKRSEDLLDLERTKAELKKLMDYSLDIICTTEKKRRFLNVSAAALKIWGYLPDELIDKPYLDYVYPEEYDLTNKATIEITGEASKTNIENRYIHKQFGYTHYMVCELG
jgi:PAS domain S-box-containing protein